MKGAQRILVTGGTGFLGSYVTRLLINEGYQVRVLCRNNSDRSLLGEVKKGIEFFEGDLLDVPSLEDAVKDVDVIVHTAAMIGFDPARRSEMQEVNITGTENLVNVALDASIRQFVHISSTAALGRKGRSASINENSIWQKSRYNSNYAKSKRKGEMEAWRGFAEGLPVTVLNPAVILGAGFWDRPPVDLFTRVYKGMPFFPTGSNGFVDVRDVAKFVLYALENRIIGERIILSAENLSWKDIFDQMAINLGVRKPSIPANQIVSYLALPFFRVKSLLTGKTPIITSESIRISRGQFRYDNHRSVGYEGFFYRPIAETIGQTSKAFLDSWPEGKSFAMLSF